MIGSWEFKTPIEDMTSFMPPVIDHISAYRSIALEAYCTPYSNIEITRIKLEAHDGYKTFPQLIYMYYWTNISSKFKVYEGTYNKKSYRDPYTEILTINYPYVSGATWYGGLSEETGDDLRKITITSIDETQEYYEDFKTWFLASATKIS